MTLTIREVGDRMVCIMGLTSALVGIGGDKAAFEVQPGDYKAILGAWSVQVWIYSGMDWHVGQNAIFRFEKHRICIPINDDIESKYNLDPKAHIPTIDIADVLGRPLIGIYRLRGDTLLMCLTGKDNGRPSSFESAKDEDVFLIKLKRLTEVK